MIISFPRNAGLHFYNDANGLFQNSPPYRRVINTAKCIRRPTYEYNCFRLSLRTCCAHGHYLSRI